MKRLLALLLAVAMICSLSACGGETSTDTGTTNDSVETTNTGSPANENEADGESHVLTVGLDVEPTSLDPNASADGQGGMFVSYSVFGTLWMLTADGETNMVLAESYDLDDTQLTIHIREDANFADGNPVTAEDVLYSMNRAAQGTGSMRMAALDLENATMADEKTLTIPLVAPSATLIEDLNILMVMEKSWCEQSEENIGLNVMSSGAYNVVSWETGMGIVLEKNPEYYNADNVYYDRVEVSFVGSEDTRLLSFEGGEYDIICLTSSASVDEIAGGARSDASVVTAPIQSVTGIIMTTTFSDFDTFQDENVRQAIGYAIDVPTLVSSIMGSAYTEATSMLPSSNYAYLECGNYSYDLDKAKELLAESGYDENNHFAFTMTVSDAGMNKRLAEAVQAMLSQANIDMAIDTQDGATYMNNMIANTIECGFTTYMGSYEPAGIVNARRSNIPANMSKFGDSDLEALLEACCTSADDQETRIAMWHDLQEQAYEYCDFIPLYESNQNYAVADSVEGSTLTSSVQGDGYLFATNLKGN
jgi:ABC-type transport system substrate-binding protein